MIPHIIIFRNPTILYTKKDFFVIDTLVPTKRMEEKMEVCCPNNQCGVFVAATIMSKFCPYCGTKYEDHGINIAKLTYRNNELQTYIQDSELIRTLGALTMVILMFVALAHLQPVLALFIVIIGFSMLVLHNIINSKKVRLKFKDIYDNPSLNLDHQP